MASAADAIRLDADLGGLLAALVASLAGDAAFGAPAAPAAYAADLELARRCASGDGDAQRALVERHAPLVFSICRRSGLSREEAEDVSQDVFRLAFEALPRYRGEARLSSFLYTFVKRRVADHLRSSAVRHAAPAGVDAEALEAREAAPEEGPEAGALRAGEAARVRRAVESLPEPARAILVAFYLAELSVKEIAAAHRMNEATVKTHLYRGRLELRRRLEAP